MWPYSTNSSRVLGAPATPKIHIKLDDFAENDKVLDVTLTVDIKEMLEWLSVSTDSSFSDVVRGLLFNALYGRVAYEQLVHHVNKLTCDEDDLDDDVFAGIWNSPVQETPHSVASFEVSIDEIRLSPARGTPADIKHVGKANVNRKIKIPRRMLFDLDRQAVKAEKSLTTYVRGLLFKSLQGEVNFTQWQYERDEQENRVKPPSRK